MKVALIPMRVDPENFEKNWREFTRRFKEAIRLEPDFLVFPEYCLTGFEEWDFSGAKLYGEIVIRVSELARENSVYIILGLLESYKNCIYNSALLINREGDVLLKHRKFQEPMKFCTGNTVKTARTEFGKVALIICGDLYNKRIAKWIKKKKPHFVFVPMEYSPKYGITSEDLKAMSERVKILDTKTFIANTYPPGGAWVFDENGELLAQTQGDEILFYEVVQ